MKQLLKLTLATILVTSSITGLNAANDTAKPNVILIMADDLGYGDLGSYGQKQIKTPHLDKLAQEGMRFTNFYSGAPVCAPSRSVLMTGLHTGHTRVRGNFSKVSKTRGLGGGMGRVFLKKEDMTFTQELQQAGYTTAMAGKWGLGEPDSDGLPAAKGFDHFLGYLNQRRAHTYYPEWIWKNNTKLHLKGNLKGQKQQYTHDLFEDFAVDFVTRHKDKPFFLYLPYLIPHAKYEIPELGEYKNKQWSHQAKVHAAMISRMDNGIGKLVDTLKKLKIDNNTILFFCSDNGAAKRWDGVFDSSGSLRGKKRDLYEGGIRIPMIVRWPGEISANQVSSAPCWLTDIYPTVLAIGLSPLKQKVDGLDISPTLLSKPQDLKNRILYWEFYEGGFKQALRKGPWKAIRSAKEPTQLYNLTSDSEEKINLATKHPEIVKQLESLMSSERTNSIEWPSTQDN